MCPVNYRDIIWAREAEKSFDKFKIMGKFGIN